MKETTANIFNVLIYGFICLVAYVLYLYYRLTRFFIFRELKSFKNTFTNVFILATTIEMIVVLFIYLLITWIWR